MKEAGTISDLGIKPTPALALVTIGKKKKKDKIKGPDALIYRAWFLLNEVQGRKGKLK